MTAEECKTYLETFKGPLGKCARLGELYFIVGTVSRGWRPESAHGKAGIGDPTMSAALTAGENERRIADLEDEIGRVGELCLRVTHGDVIDNYYLTDEDVVWSQLANEYGVTVRTLTDWRNAACDELAKLI